MHERVLREYARSTERAASRTFTSGVFTRIGLDRYATASSALGDVYVAWNARGVSAVRLAPDGVDFEAWFAERFGRRAAYALELDDPTLAAARARLSGGSGSVPLDLSACSPFEAAVLAAAGKIARGHARPYGWLARELDVPLATRAVGSALGRNPVPLLIPCHRVIRSDNGLGGYVFGSDAKRRLLEFEGLDVAAIQAVGRRGFRYIGCSSDGTFCLPTCGDIAASLDTPGYLGLRSSGEAAAQGLQPCGHCRPIAA